MLFNTSVIQINRIVILGAIVASVSACSSLPTLSRADIDSRALTYENTERLDNYLAEWDSVYPTIKKLERLESDLSYLVEELSSETPSPSEFVSQTQTYSEKKALGFSDTSFLSAESGSLENKANNNELVAFNSQTETSVQLDGAPPPIIATPAPRLVLSKEESDRIDNKFSAVESTNLVRNVRGPSKNNDKVRNKMTDVNCNSPFLHDKGSFAIHLASYSSLKSAQQGWNTLREANTPIICEKTSKAAQVNVNGKRFYSLRIGPYATRENALNVCKQFGAKGQYCGVAQFEGERL